MSQKFQWTEDQKKALTIINDWWNSVLRQPTLCLSGFAGTGKTTLIAKLPKLLKKNGLGINVAYATLTAKASLVLRNKGVPASTIHSLIYDTEVRQDEKTHKIKYIFHLKKTLDKDLIIIDQASMVSDVLYSDLKSFGIPLLFIGDSFQLPPINSEFNLMSDRFVVYTMKDIVRQQKDNTIIKMSVKLRNFQNIPYMNDKQFIKIHHSRFNKQDLIKYQQIITGKNVTRIDLNKYCRKLLHYDPQHPIQNDRMIFLRNNYQDNVFNGQQIILTKKPRQLGDGKYQIEGQDVVTNDYVDVNIIDDFINNLPADIQKKRFASISRSDFNQIDYAYAISCHKCVSGNTKIFTDNGIIQIKNYNGQKIFDGTNYVYPKQFINNGLATVKTITTHNGFTNTTTLNHNHIVIDINGQIVKKKTNQLKIGDVFLIAKNSPDIQQNYLHKNTHYIPEIIDQEFAEWLGLFIADGCLFSNRKNGFRFLKAHKDVVERFMYLTNKLFSVNYEIKKYHKTKKICYMYQIFNTNIVKQLFEKYPCLTPNKKYIPNEILLSSKSVQKSFLRGIFEDGYVDKNGQIVFSSSTYQISKDIQSILLRNNIVSKIHMYKKKSGFFDYRVSILYDYLNKFKNEIGFISEYKNNKCITYKRKQSHFAYSFLSNLILGMYKDNNESPYKDGFKNDAIRKKTSRQSAIKFIQNKKFINDDRYTLLKFLLDNFQFDLVQNISDQFKTETYCFEIDNTHMFVQNGILSGNSQGSQFNDVLIWDDLFAINNQEMRNRWLYTAITRASKRVTWIA